MPEIRTAESETSAGRNTPVKLTGGDEFASDAGLEGTLFDGENVPGLSNSGANSFIGKDFGSNNKGIVEEVRFFMDYFSDKSVLAGNLKLQGSLDDFSSSIVDLVIVGEEIHEGWNSYDLDPSVAQFNSYRLFNAEAGGLNDIGEL